MASPTGPTEALPTSAVDTFIDRLRERTPGTWKTQADWIAIRGHLTQPAAGDIDAFLSILAAAPEAGVDDAAP